MINKYINTTNGSFKLSLIDGPTGPVKPAA